MIQVIGAPADSIRDALTDVSLRLVPLSERAVTALVASTPVTSLTRFRVELTATQKQDVRTIATAALLLVGADLAETEVAAITPLCVWTDARLCCARQRQGTQVSAANARLGLSIPQHIAAAKALDGLSSLQEQRPFRRLPRHRRLLASESHAVTVAT